MGEYIVAGSKSDRRRTVDYLKRKARSVELQAARSAPLLASQLKSLAAIITAEADDLENSAAG
jgi:hypothetical protein